MTYWLVAGVALVLGVILGILVVMLMFARGSRW